MDSYWSSQAEYWEQRVDSTYSNVAFPTTALQPLVVNYYDDYGFEGSYRLGSKDITASSRTKTLVTGTKVYKDDGTSPLLTASYYDDRARLIQSALQNHLGGTDYVTNTYSFVGELLTSRRVHKVSGDSTVIFTKNEYDHVGRLLAVKQKINGQDTVILARNEYNEIGQLVRKYLGGNEAGTAFHDTITYAYNARGWLTSADATNFSYGLNYNSPTEGAAPQYNGNISEQHWERGGQPAKYFTYAYDRLNRLTDGNSTTGDMREELSYDDMGNIVNLKRDNHTTGTSYTYTGNRLKSLTGEINTTQDYTYDGNGNATRDRTGMNFSYNHLNLPDSAWNGTVNVGYLYDALGTKLRKYSSQGGNRDYVGGIEYNGTGSIDIIHTGEGIAYRNTSDNTYTYRYNLTDHLGNVRATVYRNPVTNQVEVLQSDDYYPFGKQYVVSAGDNTYLYNGKELQGELGGQYDYGARFYDAEIGRWNVVDPLAENSRRWSPYTYGLNNPIRFIDPDGRSSVEFTGAAAQYAFGVFKQSFLAERSSSDNQDRWEEEDEQDDPKKKKGSGKLVAVQDGVKGIDIKTEDRSLNNIKKSGLLDVGDAFGIIEEIRPNKAIRTFNKLSTLNDAAEAIEKRDIGLGTMVAAEYLFGLEMTAVKVMIDVGLSEKNQTDMGRAALKSYHRNVNMYRITGDERFKEKAAQDMRIMIQATNNLKQNK